MGTIVSWRKPLILAVVFFVLGSAAMWSEYKHKPQKEASEEAAKKVFALKDTAALSILLTDDIRTFEMGCLDAEAKLCKPGDNSKWQVLQPMKLKADDSNVNSLLSSLSQLNASDTIDLKEETPEKRAALLKEYGLDLASRMSSATKKIHLRTASGETVVYLGLTHPIGDSFFALTEQVAKDQKAANKPDENKVLLIPSYVKANMDHDLTYWRDKKLLTLSAHEVESFMLDGTKAHLTGARKDGQWLLKSSKPTTEELDGDIENVDNMLTGATYLTAKTFISDNKNDAKSKAELKGTKPVLTLTMKKEKGSAKEDPAPVTLTFFQKSVTTPKKTGKGAKNTPEVTTPRMFATVSNLDPLYELEPTAKDRIDKELKDLRLSKLITSMERFTAKRLEFAGPPIGAPSLLLTNKDGKWSAQDKTDVSNDKVQATLDKLSGNRIKDFLQGSAYPTGEDQGLRLTLGDEKVEAKRQLVFWKKDAKLYARDLTSKRKEAFLVDSAIETEVPWKRDFFKKTEPAPAPSAKPMLSPATPPMPGVKGKS